MIKKQATLRTRYLNTSDRCQQSLVTSQAEHQQTMTLRNAMHGFRGVRWALSASSSMRKTKGITNTSPKAQKDNHASPMGPGPSLVEILPGNSYIPVVGVHTTLLLFSGLFLPRTTFLRDIAGVQIDPTQHSSLDRPQHPFLEPLTSSPLSTLVYICVGATVLQGWWAGYVRDWWSLSVIEGSENEKRLEKAIIDRQKIEVRFTTYTLPPTFNSVNQAFTNAWLATFVASAIIHGLLVLFGAPLTWLVISPKCLCNNIERISVRSGIHLAPSASRSCSPS